jgi:glycerol dehydrogenase
LPDHLKSLGAKAFFLVDGIVLDSMGASLRTSLEASGLAYDIERFGGECCAEEIARIGGLARTAGADIVVGVGGSSTCRRCTGPGIAWLASGPP